MEGGKKGRPCIVGLSLVSEAFVPTIQGVWRMQMSKDRSLAIGCLDFLFTREEEFNGVCFCFSLWILWMHKWPDIFFYGAFLSLFGAGSNSRQEQPFVMFFFVFLRLRERYELNLAKPEEEKTSFLFLLGKKKKRLISAVHLWRLKLEWFKGKKTRKIGDKRFSFIYNQIVALGLLRAY